MVTPSSRGPRNSYHELPGQCRGVIVLCLLSGRPTTEDLELIRTRKPEEPKLEVTLKDGSKRNVWCTFGPQQIDIDVASPSGLPSRILLCTAHPVQGFSAPDACLVVTTGELSARTVLSMRVLG